MALRAPLASIVSLLVILTAARASAQYKNQSFELDTGYWLITKPRVVDKAGNLKDRDKRPLRLANGYRIGGESNIKMDQDLRKIS